MSNNFSKQRLTAFKKQSGRCYYCGSHMWLTNVKKFAFEHNISESEAARFQCTAEHMLARCDGGNNSSENIVAACRFCNNTRHKRKTPLVPNKFKSLIQKRLKKGKWHPHELHHLRFWTVKIHPLPDNWQGVCLKKKSEWNKIQRVISRDSRNNSPHRCRFLLISPRGDAVGEKCR